MPVCANINRVSGTRAWLMNHQKGCAGVVLGNLNYRAEESGGGFDWTMAVRRKSDGG